MLELAISEQATIREALELINRTAMGFACAVDSQGRLSGVVTDGDVRRALLKGIDLQATISQIMSRHFKALPVTASPEDIRKILSGNISFVPLLDEAQRPVDFASAWRFHRIPVAEPSLTGNELNYVIECVETNWVSSQGRFVKRFEQLFCEYHESPYALAVCNGTAALHLALVALGIKTGDEVIVPDLTFAASANAVLYTGATPVFVDVDPDTWTMDVEQVRRALTPKTKALMPVHLYGHPCDMDPLRDLAKSNGLVIVEDCAEALGSEYRGKPVGVFGEAGCFSFFGNKTITTGEGGMILFKEQKHYDVAKRLRDHGMDPAKRYWHDAVGYNYRLTNVQAALGVAQMEKISSIAQRKFQIAEKYCTMLSDIPGVRFPKTAEWAKNVYWLFSIVVESAFGLSRDELMRKLLHNGVESRPLFYPLHVMPPYQEFARTGAFPVTEHLSAAGLSLPSAVSLKDAEIEHIGEAIHRILGLQNLYQKTTAPC